jgi:hypothetical protein
MGRTLISLDSFGIENEPYRSPEYDRLTTRTSPEEDLAEAGSIHAIPRKRNRAEMFHLDRKSATEGLTLHSNKLVKLSSLMARHASNENASEAQGAQESSNVAKYHEHRLPLDLHRGSWHSSKRIRGAMARVRLVRCEPP